MQILTPILILGYIAYSLAACAVFAGAILWFFDIHSWLLGLVALMGGYAICMIPFGTLAVLGLACYFLVEHYDWSWWAAILFCCPGIIFMVLSLFSGGISALYEKLRGY